MTPDAAAPLGPGAPVNASALGPTEAHAMREVFRTARRYSQGRPRMNLNRVFGVTSFEPG